MFLEMLRHIRAWKVQEVEQKFISLKDRRRISIVTCADQVPDAFFRLHSGDTWAKYEMMLALGRLGYAVTDVDPDVVIHFFGSPVVLPERACKVLWIYSHPERVTPDLLKKYDRIFCLSKPFIETMKGWGFDAEFAPGATSRTPLSQSIDYDIVFVANARTTEKRGRRIIQDLGEISHRLTVWGMHWEDILSPQQIGGTYYDYTRLQELYRSAQISLCDHSPAMREQGFVALRVFDILASGGFCICDNNVGLEEIFQDAVPSYTSREELRNMIDLYMSDDHARKVRMSKGCEISLKYSWGKRAQQFLKGLDPKM